MKVRKLFMFAAAMAGFALSAAEQPASVPAESCGEGCSSFEWPPRLGIYISELSGTGASGTVGISLTGVPEGEYFSGILAGFCGEDFSELDVHGLWAGWYGKMRNQTGIQFGFVNIAWQSATSQTAIGANAAETCNGVQLSGLINRAADLAGFQAAGFGNLAKTANSFQLAGLLNQAEYGSGLQLALFNMTGAPLDNPDREPQGMLPGFVVQAGLENYSVDRKVFQLGLYNSKSAPGFQIGLVNRSDTGLLRWMPLFNW